MWESAAEVTRKAVVKAPPEQVWSLVAGSAAWSLRPGCFAFDAPPATGTGPMRCWFTPAGTGWSGTVFEVREDVPGQVQSLLSLGTKPVGRQTFTLSVQPRDRGALVKITVTVTVPREDKADFQAAWRKELREWLGVLTDVAEGRRPWPEPGIPAPVREACLARPLLVSPQGTASTAVIRASPRAVWQAVRAPGVPADRGQEHTAIGAGLIPGSPENQPGEIPYVIIRHPEGKLTAAATIVRELDEGRTMLVQRMEPPHLETRYRVEPGAGGTRLEITMCWPDAPVTDQGEQLRSRLVRAVQDGASAYRAFLEPGGAG